jgi:hypothetical protein
MSGYALHPEAYRAGPAAEILSELITNDDACHLAALLDGKDKIRNRAATRSRRANSLLMDFSSRRFAFPHLTYKVRACCRIFSDETGTRSAPGQVSGD